MPSQRHRIQGGIRHRIQGTRRPNLDGFALPVLTAFGLAVLALLACDTPSEVDDLENAAPAEPSDPVPAHNAVGVPIIPALILGWSGGEDPDGDPVMFEIYMGSIEPLLHIGTTAERGFEVPPQTVTPLSEVQWRVLARDSRGASTLSPTWRFGTGDTNQAPRALSAPLPADGDTAVTEDIILRWQGGEDPEGGPTRFTLHLDISPELESATVQIESDILEREFDPDGELERGTTYYWRITAADSLLATTVSPVYRFTTGPNRAPLAPLAPEPADDALEIPIAPELRWSGSADPDGDRVTYHVYLETESPPSVLLGTTDETRLSAGTLGYLRTYYWQVIAEDEHGGRTPGAVWQFATEVATNHPPSAPSLPSPAEGAAGVAVQSGVSWATAIDPDGDPVAYDLYLGTTDPPPFALQLAAISYDPPGNLAYDAAYTWRVVARDIWGAETPGPTWHFATESPPNQVPLPAGNPAPDDGAIDVPIEITLTFDPGIDPDGDRLSYDIHFGTENPPPFIGNRTETRFDPPANLAFETPYFWQVMTRDERSGPVPGPVWSFVTEGPNVPPAAPHDPEPANGAAGVTVDVVLSWLSENDPDGDPVTFDVYFGTDDPPAFAASRAVPSFDPPGDLDPATIYYWRVVALDSEGGKASGGTWTFTTAD